MLCHKVYSQLPDEDEEWVHGRVQGGAANESGSQVHWLLVALALPKHVGIDATADSLACLHHSHLGAHVFELGRGFEPRRARANDNHLQTSRDVHMRNSNPPHPWNPFCELGNGGVHHLGLPPLEDFVALVRSQLHHPNFVSTLLELLHRLQTHDVPGEGGERVQRRGQMRETAAVHFALGLALQGLVRAAGAARALEAVLRSLSVVVLVAHLDARVARVHQQLSLLAPEVRVQHIHIQPLHQPLQPLGHHRHKLLLAWRHLHHLQLGHPLLPLLGGAAHDAFHVVLQLEQLRRFHGEVLASNLGLGGQVLRQGEVGVGLVVPAVGEADGVHVARRLLHRRKLPDPLPYRARPVPHHARVVALVGARPLGAGRLLGVEVHAQPAGYPAPAGPVVVLLLVAVVPPSSGLTLDQLAHRRAKPRLALLDDALPAARVPVAAASTLDFR
mmetsp:Transcript_10330/g.19581  ORF Transcript_10330/g.19581 Transcript_10330/m.19581 type:complete len:445 (-) Transcript_10330:520-1854(-)